MERLILATNLRRCCVAGALTAIVLAGSACGGYGSAAPTTPTQTPAPPADAITINIVATNGAQSFSPNPATVPATKSVVWHNLDTVTHRVVFDDGELDTGNIAPGAFSTPMGLVATGAYHCSIHPSMVGRIE
jgi:plastocyanin